jgi:hypothetical protein
MEDNQKIPKETIRSHFSHLKSIKIMEMPNALVTKILRDKFIDKGMNKSLVMEYVLPSIKIQVSPQFVEDEEFCDEILTIVCDAVENICGELKEEFGLPYLKKYLSNNNVDLNIPEYED